MKNKNVRANKTDVDCNVIRSSGESGQNIKGNQGKKKMSL